MSEATEHLRRRFAERLLRERPRSVLDIGCGRGELLAWVARGEVAHPEARREDLRVVGVEADPDRALEATSRGAFVARASAEALPFRDASFDWVVIRHVLHHLEDPKRVVREAARLARSGLVIAEPWRDPALAEQALGARLDRWTKKQDRRAGHLHADDIPPLDIRDMLPEAEPFEVSAEYYVRPARRPAQEVADSIEAYLERLDPEDPDRAEGAELLRETARTGVGWTGTATLVARRR